MQFRRSRHRHDARYAAEGQRAVEVFLRTNDQSVSKQLGSPNDLGDFLRLDGTGFIYPVWNIQGYHFLDLHRTAHFTNGIIPMRVIVTEGRVTAPNLNTVGTPEVHNGSIFISHPDVKAN